MSERCEKCGQPTEYQGWKNYETWNVALWIDNERGTYDAAREYVADAEAKAPTCDQVEGKIWTVEQAERFILVDSLKDWVRDQLMPDLGATCATDLLGAALDRVDWHEIASNYLSERNEAGAR